MSIILIKADSTCSLQNNVTEDVKTLILEDNIGSRFEEIKEWDTTIKYPIWQDGVVVEDEERLAIETTKYKVKVAEEAVNSYIHNVVKAYNTANGTNFESVHNCSNYRDIEGYTHKQFCTDVWQFNVDVWEKARTIQIDVDNGVIAEPTLEEFIAMLPVYDGVSEA